MPLTKNIYDYGWPCRLRNATLTYLQMDVLWVSVFKKVDVFSSQVHLKPTSSPTKISFLEFYLKPPMKPLKVNVNNTISPKKKLRVAINENTMTKFERRLPEYL